jgi:putative molybdopterin biosynthesis protein
MTSPFVSDIPAEQARRAWREACAAAGCPSRVDAVVLPVGKAVGRVTAESVWARRSSPAFDSAAMDGIAVRAAETVGAADTTPVLLDDFAVVDTGDPLPAGYDAVVMREHVCHTSDGRAELRAAVPPYQHVRSIGDTSAPLSCSPRGSGCAWSISAARAAAGVVELVVRRPPRLGSS